MSGNPKDLLGVVKVPTLSVIPSSALIHMGVAMRYGAYEAQRADGGKGYEPFNWRTTKIQLSVYLDAILRHALDLVDGEDYAADSGAHHAAHIMSCAGILLDAMECGTLVDDRPPKGPAPEVLERLRRKVEEKS